jgi:iron-sulfur cluster insertion protein
MNEFKLSITDGAKEKIKDVINDQHKDKQLRVAVQGGGCAGFMYDFFIDDFSMEDFKVDIDADISVVIDPISAQYLSGSELDYKDELFKKQFVINNPNANSSCGCGTSFNIVKS